MHYKFLFPYSLLKFVALLFLFSSITTSFHAQKMMQGSISSLGVNMRSHTNQVSVVVGDINNEYKNYSDRSISSGFIHTSLIYRFEEDDNNNTGYGIFPNPTSSEIQILFGEAIDKNYTIRVFDSVGKLVEYDILLKDTFGTILDFSSLATGVYTIQIQVPEGENIIEKIVKN